MSNRFGVTGCPGRMISPRLALILFFSAIAVLSGAISCGVAVQHPVAPSNRPTIDLSDCRFASYTSKALCGKVEVFENQRSQAGRKIVLSVVVLPALESQPERDPVFFLAGGPGQGAAKIAAAGENMLMSQLRRRRDLVFIDQRGTGDSHPLNCNLASDPAHLQSHFEELFPIVKVRACREKLERHSDLRFFTTGAAVADLDHVRALLGYDKINLYGVSYGTLVALHYVRQYPGHVRAVALAGVTNPAAKLPLHYARGAQDALDKLFRDCALDDSCRTAYPDLAGDFAKALAILDQRPVSLTIPHPKTREAQNVTVTRSAFTERLRIMLYNGSTASLLPLLIHQAARLDWTAFARAATRGPGSSHHATSMGMYLSVTCSESVPLITRDELARETSGTFLGEYRTRRHLEACAEWPRDRVPAEYHAPVYSAVPVLMLTGELDGATPPNLAAEAAKSLSNSRHIVLPGTAHEYGSGCATSIIAQFLATAITTLNTDCTAHLKRPPFARTLPVNYAR
jgi:pimeloyl-ACP methyl ester carboxylesterase